MDRLVEPAAVRGHATLSGRYLPPDPNTEFSIRVNTSGPTGEAPPDMPWDFPPGSPGSDHTGEFNGGRAPKDWLERIRNVDPNFDLAWQPVAKRWVIWRHKADGSWRCVMAVENPATGEYMEMNQLFVSYLYATDPARYPRAVESFLAVRDMKRREAEARRAKFDDAVDEADYLSRMHARIGTHGKGNKASMHAHLDAGALPDNFKM